MNQQKIVEMASDAAEAELCHRHGVSDEIERPSIWQVGD